MTALRHAGIMPDRKDPGRVPVGVRASSRTRPYVAADLAAESIRSPSIAAFASVTADPPAAWSAPEASNLQHRHKRIA